MYSRRASLAILNSLKPLLKVSRTRHVHSLKESLYLVRNISTVADRTDSYNVFDGDIPETSLDYGYDNQTDRFYGRNFSGGVEQNGSPNGVLGPNPFGQYGKFDPSYLKNCRQIEVQHNRNNGIFGRNLDGVNHDQGSAGVYGQSYGEHYGNLKPGNFGSVSQSDIPQNSNCSGKSDVDISRSSFAAGSWGTSMQNHGGMYGQEGLGSINGQFHQSAISFSGGYEITSQLSSPRHFAGNIETSQQKFGGNYAGKFQQSGGDIHYSNGGNYQQNWSKSQIDRLVDSHVTCNLKRNEESVEDAEESQPMRKVEDLDELCKEGKLKEAVELLKQLAQQGVLVDLSRYLILMKACGENKDLEEAKFVHDHLLKSMPHPEVRIYNQILEMYSRCGSMDDALAVFDQMPKRNLTSWDILIYWLAKNGHGEDSIDLFEQFKRSGLKPDGPMFFGVFSACGILGDAVEGMLHFESMSKDYGIVPSMDHYVSIVDMLGTAGCLDEAFEFIEKMPVEPGVEIWETLMNFCRIQGNTELGDQCADIVQLLDPSRLNEQSREGLIPINASDLAREKEKKKLSGQNLLEVRSRVHEYRAGDRSHPDHERIYSLLRGLKQHMKEVGYVPETKFVLHDVDVEAKEEALMAHSERLAAAQGFLTTPARSPLRIIKNLRVCGDCHNAFKMISKIVGREIIARDSKRFHHFKGGLCSCNDYW